jgi:hypothetical protein
MSREIELVLVLINQHATVAHLAAIELHKTRQQSQLQAGSLMTARHSFA